MSLLTLVAGAISIALSLMLIWDALVLGRPEMDHGQYTITNTFTMYAATISFFIWLGLYFLTR